MQHKNTYFLFCLLLLSCSVFSQRAHIDTATNTDVAQTQIDSSAWFLTRDYGKYFKADHYAPIVSISTGIGLNKTDYNINLKRTAKYIPINETILGGDIPIYQKLWNNDALSFSFPLSFSVWFDFSEEKTAPILNTDYRFALLEINYLHKFHHPIFKNIGVKYIPYFHESTHIGDELTIARITAESEIIRVNVSYESMNLAITLNDPLNKDIKNRMYRIGAKILLNPSAGWYTTTPLEADSALITPSSRWIEPYVQYQYQSKDCFFSFWNSMFVLSADLSFRIKFNYPYHTNQGKNFTQVETTERYLPSYTLLAGWHFYNSIEELSNVGLYLKAYTGLNYHGQFRNLPNYQFYGISITYDL